MINKSLAGNNTAVTNENDDLSPALTEYLSKGNKKKIYKSIQELNPNPNLLSKKAIKRRKKKMEQKLQQQRKTNPFKSFDSMNYRARPKALGGRQLHIIKTSTLSSKFNSNSTKNAIKLPPRKISSNPQPIRILGSRQKELTNLNDLLTRSLNSKTRTQDNARLPGYLTSRFQDIDSTDNIAINDGKSLSTADRLRESTVALKKNILRSKYSNIDSKISSNNAERSLGSRQLGLIKIRPSVSTPSKPQSKRKKGRKRGRKGRVRKVLKGRRKITSTELRQKASNFFP